jgi:hypothetical protein
VSKWSREWLIAPNNRNFPSGSLPAGSVSNMDNDRDVEALMTGIYGSAVPCLCTYPNEVSRGTQVAQIATTLRNGKGNQLGRTNQPTFCRFFVSCLYNPLDMINCQLHMFVIF